MRIGISALFSASGGSLTNLGQLLRSWTDDGTLQRHEVVLFTSAATYAGLKREAGADVLDRVNVRLMRSAGRGLLSRLFAEQFAILPELRKQRLDVLFCPANIIPYGTGIPTVAVFQNAAPFCPSVTFRSLRGRRWLQFRLLGLLVRLTARLATRVIFISQYFRDLFVRRFDFAPDRAAVILRAGAVRADGAEDRQLEESMGIRRPYVLSVSSVSPYKNLVELIDGFAKATRERNDSTHQLVIVGTVNFPWYLRQMIQSVKRNELEGRVIVTGELPHRNVVSLLAGCESFVFTSTCENCPTALIEAMSFGLPIACSDVGVMPEVGGDAVRYFDPDDSGSIKDALVDLITDDGLRDDLSRRARARAGGFPEPAEVARRTLAVIESVASAG